jgi:hypothetical protein
MDQPVPRVLDRQALLCESDDLVQGFNKQHVDQLLALRKAAVNGPDPHLRLPGDVVIGPTQTALRKYDAGRVDDPAAVALSVAA